MFKESLFKLHEGGWLAITLDHSAEHDPPTRDIDLAYAVIHAADGTERDVLTFLSLPVSADERAAKAQDRTAAGQLELAEQAKGTKSEARYRDNVLRYSALAAALRKTTRLLPRWLFPLGGTRLLCGFHIHGQPVRIRVVDVATEMELWTADGAEILSQIDNVGASKRSEPDPEKEIRRLTKGLDLASMSEAEAQELMQKLESLSAQQNDLMLSRAAPLKVRPLAAMGNRLLLDAGMERILISFDDRKFSQLARWPSLYGGWPVAAPTSEGFIFHCVTGQDDRDQVQHVRAKDAFVLDVWPSKGKRVLSSAAGSMPPSNTVALAALGGEVVLQSAGTDVTRKLPKLLSVDQYDSVEVGLSPNARIVGQCRSYRADEIALFDVARDLAVTLKWPNVEPPSANSRPQIRTPAFALAEDDLLLLSAGKLTRFALTDLDWQAPIASTLPIKRRKTPALTLDAALQQTPLADIAGLVRSWFRPGVLLVPKRLRGDRAPVGASKSGGHPDLAAESEWPRYRGQPMAFMLQVNLAEVSAIEPEVALPRSGLLSVFLAFDDFPMPSFYSDANSDPEGCRIIYTPSGQSLQRTAPPPDMPSADYEGKDVVCSYTVRTGGAMLPQLSNDRVQRANLTPQQSQAYRALALAINGDDDAPSNWTTRLGGYPALLQNDDLHLNAETFVRGLSLCDSTYAQWSDLEFQRAAQSWRHLLQLSEGKEGWTLGDAGLLHILVRDEQWQSAEFSPAWAIGVCH